MVKPDNLSGLFFFKLKEEESICSPYYLGGGMYMFGAYLDMIQKQMEVSTLKRNVNADNITNYNTPNFKAGVVKFDQLLDKEASLSLKETNNKHIPLGGEKSNEPIITKDVTTEARQDGNNVDLTQEMVETIRNNYLFNLTVQASNHEFTLNRIAIGKV
jgi:flagellar basal-body rod protein FlgB